MTSKKSSSFNRSTVLHVCKAFAEIRAIEPAEFTGLGQHLLIDFHDCRSIASSTDELEQIMLESARRIKATVVSSSFHQFNPHGLSGVVVIAESHLAVHTWPEHQAVCVDLFTCSDQMDSMAGMAFLFESFAAGEMTIQTVPRGPVKNNQVLNEGDE